MTRSRRPSGWRRPARLLATLLVVVWVLLGAAPPATAHAQLVSTDPVDGAVLAKAPDAVTLTFNEPVRLTGQEITVYDADGDQVRSSATSAGTEVAIALEDPAGLARGTYVVAWFVLSTDGHPISGSLTFSVGEPSDEVAPPPPPPTSSGLVRAVQGVVTFATYAGLLVVAGLVAFVALVLPTTHQGRDLRQRIRLLVRATSAVAVLGAVLQVPVAAVHGQGAELGDLLGSFDAALVVDEIVAAAMIVLGLGTAVAVLGDRPPAGRQRLALLAAAAIAVVAPAAAGHSRSYQPQALLIGSDVLHLAAGAVWLGGLVGLVLALRALARREEIAATTLARFSSLAGGLLLAIAATGAVMAWRILGSWSAFVDTGYGRLLLVKIGLALVIVAFGGWNRYRLLPRVRAAAGYDDRARTAGSVTRTVAVEALVVVVLLGVTGFLVNQSPRPAPVEVPPGRTGVQSGAAGELEVLAMMAPREPGANTLLVQVQDAEGEPVTPPGPPTVTLRSGDLDLGAVRLVNTDAGTYRADVVLPRPGTWQVQVGLRISRFEKPVTTVEFRVAAAE